MLSTITITVVLLLFTKNSTQIIKVYKLKILVLKKMLRLSINPKECLKNTVLDKYHTFLVPKISNKKGSYVYAKLC